MILLWRAFGYFEKTIYSITIKTHGSQRYHGKDTLWGVRRRIKIEKINGKYQANPFMW